jgi:hypothetical protein
MGVHAHLQAQAKRDDEDRKRQEAAARKAELKRLQEEEEAAMSRPKPSPKAARVSGPKVGHMRAAPRTTHTSCLSTDPARSSTASAAVLAALCRAAGGVPLSALSPMHTHRVHFFFRCRLQLCIPSPPRCAVCPRMLCAALPQRVHVVCCRSHTTSLVRCGTLRRLHARRSSGSVRSLPGVR